MLYLFSFLFSSVEEVNEESIYLAYLSPVDRSISLVIPALNLSI